MDPHSHMAHWYCRYSVFLRFRTSNICCPINGQRSVSISLIKDGVEYPLTQSGPYGRWFHSEFCDFISVLVGQCQHSVLFDSYLMNSLMSLLTELSNSPIRAFRHTCTLAGKSLNVLKLSCLHETNGYLWHPWSALKFVSALVGVNLSLHVSIENSQKLYDVQRTKTTRQKSPLQLEKIQRKITEVRKAPLCKAQQCTSVVSFVPCCSSWSCRRKGPR